MKKIVLTQGKTTFVDDEDFEYLNQFKWYAWRNKKRWYAVRNLPTVNGIRSSIKMHRLILGMSDPKIQVDHKDHNGLNNQRSNLRSCSNRQNVINRPKDNIEKRTSKFKGVHKKVYYTGAVSWIAQIMANQKKLHIGCFKTQKKAAKAYNLAAVEHQGEFAFLNKL